ncbi:type II secretion system protein [Candidatus Wolfebacteria bacterium]|nr:type II secretion system protein [Candidatus Wolfebacteria bacterium]
MTLKLQINKGFTLIELLLYITIVAITLTVFGAIVLNVLFSKAKFTAMEEVNHNARFILEKMAVATRNAQSVNSPLAGASGGILSLQMADAAKNPTIFDVSNGVLRITEGAGATANLTTNKVIVTNIQFSNVAYPNNTGAINTVLGIKYINPNNRQEYKFENTFYASAIIRKK